MDNYLVVTCHKFNDDYWRKRFIENIEENISLGWTCLGSPFCCSEGQIHQSMVK